MGCTGNSNGSENKKVLVNREPCERERVKDCSSLRDVSESGLGGSLVMEAETGQKVMRSEAVEGAVESLTAVRRILKLCPGGSDGAQMNRLQFLQPLD